MKRRNWLKATAMGLAVASMNGFIASRHGGRSAQEQTGCVRQ